MRNNNYTQPPSLRRWVFTALAIGLVVVAFVIPIYYFGVFRGSQNETRTLTTTVVVNNPTGRGGPCFNSPYGFTTIYADSQLVSFYKQLNVCWVRYQFHWAKTGKKPGIETSPNVYDWSQ